MRVEMRAQISGTRNGAPWPARGGVVDLPADEAKALVSQGLAVEVDEPKSEPVKQPAKKRAAKKAAAKIADPEG